MNFNKHDKMKIQHAIAILEAHQAWRRDESVPPKLELQSPYLIGIAMDVLIANAKQSVKELPQPEKCLHGNDLVEDGAGFLVCPDCGEWGENC